MKLILSIAICLTLTLELNAALISESSKRIDSLEAVVRGQAVDSSKITALIKLADEVFRSNPEQTYLYLKRMLNFPADSALKSRIANEFSTYGYRFFNGGNSDLALKSNRLAFGIFEELNDLENMASAYNNIGFGYYAIGDFNQGIEYFIKALKLTEQIGDKRGMALGNINIGAMHFTNEDYEVGKEFKETALNLAVEIGDSSLQSHIHKSLGAYYMEIGNWKKSRTHFLQSLQLSYDWVSEYPAEAQISRGVIHIALGDYYIKVDSAEEALKHARIALHIFQELEIDNQVSDALVILGHLELLAKELDSAEFFGLQAYLIDTILKLPHNLRNSTDLLYDVYKAQKNYKRAMHFYEIYIQMSDSLVNDDNQKTVIRQQMKYQFEKNALIKEQEAQEVRRVQEEAQQRRDNLQYSVIVIVIVVLLLGLLVAVRPLQAVRPLLTEGLIFFVFLIFFEFILVLADPYIDNWSGGAPGFKLLFNAGLAALIFPLHSLFENKLKSRIVKQ